MKPFLPALLLLALTAGPLSADPAPPAPAAPQTKAPAVQHLEAPAAAKALAAAAADPADDKEIIVLDVRTPEEFSENRIKGAKNLDLAAATFEKDVAALDRNKTYLVHCAAGGRSTRSLKIFEKLGFSSVIHLDGGLNSWKKAGLPLEGAAPAK